MKTTMSFAQAREAAAKLNARAGRKGSTSGGFFVQFIGFLCCLVMPAFWTAIAPVSFTMLTRESGKVRAVARQNLFFVIPYRTGVVEDVQKVDDRFRQGEVSYSRVNGDRQKTRSESESFLVFYGAGGPVEVSVSPINVKSTLKKAKDFLNDPTQTKVRLITVANWKFSVIGGAFVTLLAMLYVTGVILSIFRFMWRLVKPKEVVVNSPLLPTPPSGTGSR